MKNLSRQEMKMITGGNVVLNCCIHVVYPDAADGSGFAVICGHGPATAQVAVNRSPEGSWYECDGTPGPGGGGQE